MKKNALILLFASVLFINGCNSDSKEGLKSKAFKINRKITATIKSIDDDESARKAIPKLKSLYDEFAVTKEKLAKYYTSDQQIANDYGLPMFQYYMNELFPALGELGKKNISSDLMDEIMDITSFGGYQRAKEIAEEQRMDQMGEE